MQLLHELCDGVLDCAESAEPGIGSVELLRQCHDLALELIDVAPVSSGRALQAVGQRLEETFEAARIERGSAAAARLERCRQRIDASHDKRAAVAVARLRRRIMIELRPDGADLAGERRECIARRDAG